MQPCLQSEMFLSNAVDMMKNLYHRTKKHGNRVPRSIASGGESKGLKDKQFVCSECNGYFSNKGSILHHVCGSKKGKVSTLGVMYGFSKRSVVLLTDFC